MAQAVVQRCRWTVSPDPLLSEQSGPESGQGKKTSDLSVVPCSLGSGPPNTHDELAAGSSWHSGSSVTQGGDYTDHIRVPTHPPPEPCQSPETSDSYLLFVLPAGSMKPLIHSTYTEQPSTSKPSADESSGNNSKVSRSFTYTTRECKNPHLETRGAYK